jgi:hypothetical protein
MPEKRFTDKQRGMRSLPDSALKRERLFLESVLKPGKDS